MSNIDTAVQRVAISIKSPNPLILFNQAFQRIFTQSYTEAFREIVIVCIGCDRATGDALGPLVGSKIKYLNQHGITILGSLQEPTHAQNLEQVAAKISTLHKPFVIAIDAGLGNTADIGHIIIKNSGINPGSGVGKKLNAIGDMSIMGIVNVGGFMENAILQCTSLHLVVQMADLISQGLHYHFFIKQQKKLFLPS